MCTAKLVLRACSVSSFALLLLACVPLHAQAVNDGNATGFPPFGSFHGSDFDLVSLQNGNLHIDIPFAKVPRRGGGFTYRFVYDTPTWELNASRPTPTSNYLWLAAPSSEVSGWRVPPPANWGIRYAVVQENCTYQGGVASDGTPTYVTGQYEVRSMWTLVDPEGTKHPVLLRRINTPPPSSLCQEGNPVSQLAGQTFDGTGVLVDISSDANFPKIVLKDGTQVQVWSDTNGNHPLISEPSSSGGMDSSGNLVFLNYLVNDSNGNPQSYRVDYATVNLQTSFCSLAVPAYGGCTDYTGAFSRPVKLTLPTGKFYQFTWSQNAYGDLQRVDLPSGGSISYT